MPRGEATGQGSVTLVCATDQSYHKIGATMNTEHIDKRIVFLPEPQNVRVMTCGDCGIPTVHHRIGNGNAFAGWCGSVTELEGSDTSTNTQLSDAGYPGGVF